MALAKANRLESLYKHSKRPQSSLRGPGGTTERRTDRPTNQQKGFEKHAEWFRSMLSPCQKKSHSHDMQNRAVQNFPKQVQVLPLSAGNLGRSHKSTPPLDRRFPDPVLSSSRRQKATDEVLCVCSSVCASRSNGDPKRSLSKALQGVPAGL